MGTGAYPKAFNGLPEVLTEGELKRVLALALLLHPCIHIRKQTRLHQGPEALGQLCACAHKARLAIEPCKELLLCDHTGFVSLLVRSEQH